MNLLERLIERNEKRLKKIAANPDPKRMKSNLLGYEIDLDHYKELLEEWNQGKPFFPYFPSSTLARAMGARHIELENFVDQVPQEAPRYTEAARSMGLAENVCDTVILALAATKLGELPPPSLVTTCPTVSCRIWTYHMKALAELFNAPIFDIDTPNEYNEDSIKYLAGQLADFIKFAEEKIPGVKYDEDKLLDLMKTGGIWAGYVHREWEMRKLVPLPWDSRETFRQPFRRGPDLIDNKAKLLDFWEQRIQELEESIAKGVDRIEKLRVLWIWGRPVYIDPTNVLESKDVSVPAVALPPTLAIGGRSPLLAEEIIKRKLTPLEEVASSWIGGDMVSRPSRGSYGWGEDVIWACKELKCDAVVYYQVVGCLHMGSPAKIVADMVEKELGLPTLILSGREMEASYLPPAEFESRLGEFIDMVLARKK